LRSRKVEISKRAALSGCSKVFVLAAIGGLGGITGIAQGFCGVQQLVGACGDSLLQFVIELLQALLSQFSFGDVGDKTFHQAFLIRFEQQVHQHVEDTAVLAP
jgi:hypothetical protein